MGWNPFKKVKKAVGKVFEPIVKGLDKLTGGKFSKLMANKWVKGALLAVAVVTGGIAIANGVMAAGQAGVGAAAKAFATNMTMETGKTLLSTVVTGAKEFVVGVAKGLANPLKSDAGQALTGMFDSAVGTISGAPATGADQLAEAASSGASTAGKAGESAFNLGTTSSGQLPIPGMPESVSLTQGAGSSAGTSAGSFMPAAGPSTAGLSVPSLTPPAGSAFDPASWAGSSGNLMAEGAKTGVVEGVKSAAGGLVDAAGDYLKTPMGMYQAGSALQGWSQGQALQEQWDAMDEREKERYNSWVNRGTSRMPRLTVDSV